MAKIILKTIGLDCPNCANKLEEDLKKIDGIKDANVIFVTGNIEIEYENIVSLNKAKDYINHFEEVKIIENKITLKTKGLDCPNCAKELEDDLKFEKAFENLILNNI